MGVDDIECSGAIVVGIIASNATMSHSPNSSAENVRNAWVIVLNPVLNPVRDGFSGSLNDCICRRIARFGAIDGQKHRARTDIPVFQTWARIGGIGDHISSIPEIRLRGFEHSGVYVIFTASPKFIDRVAKWIRSASLIPIRMSQ